MKSLFKKRDEAFVYNKFYLSAQHKWAAKMNSLTVGFSKQKLTFLLVLFTVLSISFFVYRIFTAFSEDELPQNTNTISKIKPHN